MTNNGSWLGPLALVVGILSSMFLALNLAKRFGFHVLGYLAAIFTTFFALCSPGLAETAGTTGSMRYGMPHPGEGLAIAISEVGWWKIAIFLWIASILTSLAHKPRNEEKPA